ncbi:MAG: FHA domain-containing protein [Anaerolineae bacterium]|nr:FHA domain-containing protein [Anaerolineae bacterium]
MAQTTPGKLQLSAPDESPRTIALDQPVLRIGRLPAPENDLSLAHGLVSRRHVQIFCDRQPYRIVDLGSSNGTMVNDIPLPANEVRELRDGDRIAIGPFTLTYEAPQAIEEVLPSEPAPSPAEVPEAFTGLRVEEAPLAPPPVEPPPVGPGRPAGRAADPWIGMPLDRSRWLQYLPYIYSEDPFLGRYLLIFEDLFGPLDQIAAHFDLYLNPRTAPESYLSVLANWLGLVLDERWPAERRRAVLDSAVELYDFRGTKKGLIKLLEASTDCRVEIQENVDGPHSFRVTLQPGGDQHVDEQMVRHLIETNKPAHTVYSLQIR